MERLLQPICGQGEVVDYMQQLEQNSDKEIVDMLLYSTGIDWSKNPAFYLALAHTAKNKGLYSSSYGGRL